MRIFYRLAEYGGGISPSNPIPFHEAYGYALDAFPMMVCLLILAVMHPGRVLLGPNANLPKMTRAQKKAERARDKGMRSRQSEAGKVFAGGHASADPVETTEESSAS